MKRDFKILARILPFVFIFILVFPKINSYVSILPDVRNTENRKMASLPKFNLALLDPFPNQYADYFEDHLSVRNQLLLINNLFNYFILERSIAEEKVVIGKDGWLFRNNNALPVNAIKSSYTQKESEDLLREFEERTRYYDSLGIKYYAFIVPNKATIYPEYVNDRYHVSEEVEIETRIDRLMKYIQLNSDLKNVFYLKEFLLDKKKEQQVFFKKDHHWNNVGAFFATGFINEVLSEDFPQIENKIKLENYNLVMEREHKGNLAHTLGIQYILKEDVPYLFSKPGIKKWEKGKKRNYEPTKKFAYPSSYEKVTIVENDSLPKALIIRDSFTGFLIPYLSNSFRDAVYIWDAWKYGWNKEIVKKEKPDMVINIMVEEHLYHMVEFSDLKNLR